MPKLLLVEDDIFYRKLYKHKFEISGFEVTAVENGQEALNIIPTLKPDLVLMDIMMPVMNGYEALDKLKASPETESLPVVMLTNLSSEADTSLATKKGALGFLIKSDLTPQQLVAKVESLSGIKGKTQEKAE
jgi:CheY-like chemotaxis protein